MSTQIKRLLLLGTEFVPITMSEAVVVNGSVIPGLSSLGITTLDKVLRAILGIVGTNASDIEILEETVNNINNALANKQDKLTAGAGINISSSGVISVTLSTTLYKIVTSLPTASVDCENTIYLVPNSSGVSGNVFNEFICVKNLSGSYVWELVGLVSTDIDLSGYVTTDTFNKAMATTITATNITNSSNNNVQVTYNIPSTLYDYLDTTDAIEIV